MNTDILWNCDDVNVDTLGVFVPSWMEYELTPADIIAIVECGCASGAFMPAVIYYEANQVMTKHGDDILDYIKEAMGELPSIDCKSWSGITVLMFSTAVELWAGSIYEELAEILEEQEGEE
jgi:hypothetical protein